MIRNIFYDIKKPFIFLAILFAVSVWIGYYSGLIYPKEVAAMMKTLVKDLGILKGLSSISIFIFIFLNNAIKSYAVMLLGMFFGIVPLLFIFVNGVLLGLVSSFILHKEGVSFLLLGTVPHGLFEIPAVLIAASYGLQLGRRFWNRLRRHDVFLPYLWDATRKFTRIVIPVLLVASFIETFVTTYLLRTF